MTIVSFFIEFFKSMFLLVTWRDIIEIIFLSSGIYYFIRWLSADTQKNMIGYFYSYWIIAAASYYLQLYTMSTLLLMGFPVFIVVLCIVHQQTLQKNFIALKKITVPHVPPVPWLEELIRSCLHALHKQKDIVCIIENADSLAQFFKIASFFNADLTTDLLDMLIDASSENPCLILVDQQGKLVTLNAHWNLESDTAWMTQEVKKLSISQQQALFITAKTDALIFIASAETHLFACYIQGTVIEPVTSNQLKTVVQKYIHSSQKGNNYEHYSHQSTFKQHEHR
ncbi:MAG: hypothetical protein WA432_05205 [Candidatus Babeliaceae bacterium]